MQVMAFSTPSTPEWRWRIVNNDGALVEESQQVYLSIASATTDGRDRMRALDIKDLSERSYPLHRGGAYRRSR
jgi:hypothetical protein